MLIPDYNNDIPERTVEVALAAFPKGNPYLLLCDELGTIFEDHDFADLYPSQGQPTISPWRLALITIMQFRENLSDRQAAEAVRSRIDWKYLLGLELTDPGFDFSVLSEFRSRLLANEAEVRLLEKLLGVCHSQELVKSRGKQRTDSTSVLASIRVMNRLEQVGETVRAALNELATVAPTWLQQIVPTYSVRLILMLKWSKDFVVFILYMLHFIRRDAVPHGNFKSADLKSTVRVTQYACQYLIFDC